MSEENVMGDVASRSLMSDDEVFGRKFVDDFLSHPLLPSNAGQVTTITPLGPRYKIYLAGAIYGLSWEQATGWRRQVRAALPQVECLSPLRGKEYLADLGTLPKTKEDSLYSSAHSIVKRDKWDVQRCDLVLANLLDLPKVTIGTMVEFGWADAFHKPLIAMMGKDDIHQHPMVNEIAYCVVESVEEGIEAVRVMLNIDEFPPALLSLKGHPNCQNN